MKRREFLQMLGGVMATGIVGGCVGRLGLRRSPRSREYVSGDPRGGISLNRPPDNFHLPAANAGGRRRNASRPGGTVEMISRRNWNAGAPISSRLQPMRQVRRLTIHHQGDPRANWDVSPRQVAGTLRRIQAEHRRRLGAGDIGYHYIIDRGGNIWQGREVYYQGAHVRGHNPHNLGIMLLGNFEIQKPTAAQLRTLRRLSQCLITGYGLAAARLYAHSDLGNTRCPGRHLRPHVKALRASLA